jgi:dienelactone hydrolase
MVDVVLFHHVQGLTPGVGDFADRLRSAGHTVHLPDMFGGRTFDSIEGGMAHVREHGFGPLTERGVAAVADLDPGLVYAGFSFGVIPAQQLAQTRPGARGALFFHSCVPVTEFSESWPGGVPVQVHSMDADPSFVDEGDIEAARDLVASADDAELFLYPGNGHLFTDSSLEAYDADATALLMERVLAFLDTV